MPNTPNILQHLDPTELSEDHWIETLNDGSQVLIRPINVNDRQREADFIARLSPEARRLRFLGTIKEASPELLDRLMDVDYERKMAFVALAYEDGELVEVGVSRYAASSDGDRCECAVTVTDAWQHRGLAVLLMQYLIEAARRNGFRQMYSVDSVSNRPMHDLAHYLGFQCHADPDDASQFIHSLQL
jgi:GNAT superfamily N-acetyltransferase